LDRDAREIGFGEVRARHWNKASIAPEVDDLLDAVSAVNRQRRENREVDDQNCPVEGVELIKRADVAPRFVDAIVEIPFEDRLRVVA
jgi:hypothetical protein